MPPDPRPLRRPTAGTPARVDYVTVPRLPRLPGTRPPIPGGPGGTSSEDRIDQPGAWGGRKARAQMIGVFHIAEYSRSMRGAPAPVGTRRMNSYGMPGKLRIAARSDLAFASETAADPGSRSDRRGSSQRLRPGFPPGTFTRVYGSPELLAGPRRGQFRLTWRMTGLPRWGHEEPDHVLLTAVTRKCHLRQC